MISIDLLMRSLLASGVTNKDLAEAISAGGTSDQAQITERDLYRVCVHRLAVFDMDPPGGTREKRAERGSFFDLLLLTYLLNADERVPRTSKILEKGFDSD